MNQIFITNSHFYYLCTLCSKTDLHKVLSLVNLLPMLEEGQESTYDTGIMLELLVLYAANKYSLLA